MNPVSSRDGFGNDDRTMNNTIIIIFFIFFIPQVLLLLLLLSHQHKACRQLKIKQEMTAVGD